MGKILINGEEYSGACENATAVNYDNSLSGLDAKTVQEAIDKTNESLETKTYIDNTTDLTAFKVWRKNGIVYIVFEGVSVTNAVSGNIGTFTNQDLMPKYQSYVAVSNGNMVGISADGKLSLYKSDLTQFTTGTIFGSFSYIAK